MIPSLGIELGLIFIFQNTVNKSILCDKYVILVFVEIYNSLPLGILSKSVNLDIVTLTTQIAKAAVEAAKSIRR